MDFSRDENLWIHNALDEVVNGAEAIESGDATAKLERPGPSFSIVPARTRGAKGEMRCRRVARRHPPDCRRHEMSVTSGWMEA